MEKNSTKDCSFCKITSVCCLCGIGGYLIHISKSTEQNPKILMLLGVASIALGIGEIFDKSPFRSYEK